MATATTSKNLSFGDTTVGKKALLAVSGAVLFGFVLQHMLGNLQVFLGPWSVVPCMRIVALARLTSNARQRSVLAPPAVVIDEHAGARVVRIAGVNLGVVAGHPYPSGAASCSSCHRLFH